MLNLLLNPRSWLSIAAILIVISATSYGLYWKSQYDKSQAIIAQKNNEIAMCNINMQLLQSGVQRWKAAADQYEHQVKLKDEQVAKRSSESQKRLDDIMQTKFSKDCNQAIKEGIKTIYHNY